jgi:hypothetical protein
MKYIINMRFIVAKLVHWLFLHYTEVKQKKSTEKSNFAKLIHFRDKIAIFSTPFPLHDGLLFPL